MRSRIAPLALVALSAGISGCASITDGTEQSIIVQVQPREARCSVTREGVELGTMRGALQSFTVSKGARDILVACEAAGYEPKVVRLVSKTQTEGVMSFMFLDLGITDMITGAMWKYPSSTSIVLDRIDAPQPVTAGAAAVSAMPANRPPAAATPVQRDQIGQESYQIERMAESKACAAQPYARLIAKSSGVETYSVDCLNGDSLTVRCEFGACRVLK
jgi:hypothetical protein